MFRRSVWCVPAVIAVLAASAARAQSPAELLEKAIYAEETVGDLDQAIEIYRQVVTDTKAAEAAAAQAQFRLGQCLLKQNKNDEAMAAFKKVIQDYPDQADWVARASSTCPRWQHCSWDRCPGRMASFCS